MCFELDSEPPSPPISGAAISHEDLTLKAATATISRVSCNADGPAPIVVVILPGRALASTTSTRRLALPVRRADMSQSRSTTSGARPASRSAATTSTTWSTCSRRSGLIQEDVGAGGSAAACARLHRDFTVGFCVGGRNSWLAAASGHGLKGAVGFYGHPGERNGVIAPTQRAEDIEARSSAAGSADRTSLRWTTRSSITH